MVFVAEGIALGRSLTDAIDGRVASAALVARTEAHLRAPGQAFCSDFAGSAIVQLT